MRVLKVLGGALLVAVLAAGGLIAFLALRAPRSRPPSAEQVERTPARLARGKYLVENVSVCIDCHSERDFSRFAGPVREDKIGGGDCFPEGLGLPGRVCPPNISSSPVGVGGWTDGELLRAMREGVSRDGHALFPMMPYRNFKAMDDEDARSVVAYLRTLKPNPTQRPRTELAFPVNLLIKSAPEPVEQPVHAPPRTDPVAYGRYLVTLAGCGECHTPQEKGSPVPGMAFAGGWEMRMPPFLHVVTANITPDVETGIGRLTRDEFVGRFRSMATLGDAAVTPERQTVMPWRYYGGMSEEDLGMIYDYLRTVAPVKHAVVAFPDAKL